MREGTEIFADAEGGAPVGRVTSGAFGPSLGAPMSMAYVPAALAAEGTRLFAEVRGRRLPATVAPTPFHPTNYKR
jgi:aminomethyltransferase